MTISFDPTRLDHFEVFRDMELPADVFVSETLDLFATNLAVLRYPSWLGREVHEEIELAFEPGDYKITPGDRWTAIALRTLCLQPSISGFWEC